MIELVPLCSAVVDLAAPLSVGAGPSGNRNVGTITAAKFEGERLNATLAGPAAADWMIQNGPVGAIDVRMTIRTSDDALIHVTYTGRFDMSDPAKGMVAYVAPLFETGDDRYAWLNKVQAVGKGILSTEGGMKLTYEFHEVR